MPTANYKTIFRADYKPDLGFYDKLFQVASELPTYKDWITTGLAVTLQNFEDRDDHRTACASLSRANS
ncbi:MAG: hypothetical protein WBP73_08635 [Terriglobales bacterium]